MISRAWGCKVVTDTSNPEYHPQYIAKKYIKLFKHFLKYCVWIVHLENNFSKTIVKFSYEDYYFHNLSSIQNLILQKNVGIVTYPILTSSWILINILENIKWFTLIKNLKKCLLAKYNNGRKAMEVINHIFIVFKACSLTIILC